MNLNIFKKMREFEVIDLGTIKFLLKKHKFFTIHFGQN